MNVMGVDGISCTIDTMHEPKKVAIPIDVSLKDGIVGGCCIAHHNGKGLQRGGKSENDGDNGDHP